MATTIPQPDLRNDVSAVLRRVDEDIRAMRHAGGDLDPSEGWG